MNINDLPKGSYKEVAPLNINSLPQGSYSTVGEAAPQSVAAKTWSAIGSVAKKPLNPLSYAPAVGLGVKAIANAPADIKEGFNAGVDQVKRGVQGLKGGTSRDKLDAILNVGSGAVSTAFSPLAPVFKPVGTALEDLSNRASDTKTFQKFATSLPDLQWQRLAEEAANVGNIAGGLAATPSIARGVKVAPAKASTFVDNLTKTSEAQIEANILTKYEKGVKPLINAKMTPAKLDRYRSDVVQAVRTIKNNKDNLQFNDMAGDTIVGQTPRTLQELSDAITQTKKTIFTKYDSLAKSAGEKGATVSTEPLAKVLDEVANNEALSFSNPEAVKYALDMKQRLAQNNLADGSPMGYKKFDTETAQAIIQNYNNSLEAYYRNPSYDTASRAAIDAGIVNNLRASLDDAIESAGGSGYQGLKGEYGALKSIERDVLKATLRDARKNVKGLIDFTDILSGGQIVNGILSLNPASFASGVASKAIAEFYKYLNNPNRAIQKMFDAADSLPQRDLLNSQPASKVQPTKNTTSKMNISENATPPLQLGQAKPVPSPASSPSVSSPKSIIQKGVDYVKKLPWRDQSGKIANPMAKKTPAQIAKTIAPSKVVKLSRLANEGDDINVFIESGDLIDELGWSKMSIDDIRDAASAVVSEFNRMR
ncbi:hypothetical protein [Bradyrhizobium sp. AUGA SZCCT0431]|uniref:hypothetical protein n=1 Tax=Bradyrhizobium sp. AUGA SZCCT0431 TaxID=2807674 RepID=UPI001BA917A0|nr:hypothetical protein [Bradyrhizobium sp. AUGA SZCCT0431]MBR1146672.1 hypothetical protein [Bradyrhizobium sp. AUGA SZCCT0431]